MTGARFIALLIPAAFGLAPAFAASCSVSTGGLAFGPYQAASARDTSGTVAVSCTGNSGELVSYSMAASGSVGAAPSRTLTSGSYTLRYDIYTDISRTLIWGDGTGGTHVLSGSFSIGAGPTEQQSTFFGRIPAGQTSAKPGTYTDQTVLTVTF